MKGVTPMGKKNPRSHEVLWWQEVADLFRFIAEHIDAVDSITAVKTFSKLPGTTTRMELASQKLVRDMETMPLGNAVEAMGETFGFVSWGKEVPLDKEYREHLLSIADALDQKIYKETGVPQMRSPHHYRQLNSEMKRLEALFTNMGLESSEKIGISNSIFRLMDIAKADAEDYSGSDIGRY